MKATFLAVEPDSATRLSLEEVFTGSKFSFPKVDPTAVLEQVSREHPDLIMLDIDLPDMKSYEIAARLQMNLATSRVPVVFVSRDGRPGSSSPEMEGVLKTSETKILKQRVEELVRQSRMERSVSQAVTEATGALGDCSADFTQSELEALKKAGFEVDAEMNLGPLTKHAARYQALLGSSLSVRQAAARMGVTNGRVRQKLRNPPTLLGVRIGNAWRLPAFQFDAMGLIPNMDRIIPLLDPGLDPVAVENWFTEPNPDLEHDGVRVSPLMWLQAGKDLQVLANLAKNL